MKTHQWWNVRHSFPERITSMDTACTWARESGGAYFRRVWFDFSQLRQDEISPAACIHTHANTARVKNTDAHACAPPHHTLWHTDWLILWWACLWHTDCATLQQQRPPPLLPPLCLLPSRPPLVSMQFLAEKPLPSTPHPPFSSGGWKRGAKGKGREEDVWRAQGGDLTSLQFWGAWRTSVVSHFLVVIQLRPLICVVFLSSTISFFRKVLFPQ